MMGKLGQMMGMGGMGGMPQPTPEQIEAMQKQMGGAAARAPPAGGGIPAAPPPGAFNPAVRSFPGLGAAACRSCRASAAASIRSGARRNDVRHRDQPCNSNSTERNNDMSLKIRLSRGGAKKRPFYRIVVADARMPRDGRFVEKIGTFDPLKAKDDAERLVLDVEKAKAWIAKGAQPTDRVLRLLDGLGVAKREPQNNPREGQPKKKAQERAAAAEKAAAAGRAKRLAAGPAHRPRRASARRQGVRGEIRVKSYTGDPKAIGAYGPLTDADGVRALRARRRCAR